MTVCNRSKRIPRRTGLYGEKSLNSVPVLFKIRFEDFQLSFIGHGDRTVRPRGSSSDQGHLAYRTYILGPRGVSATPDEIVAALESEKIHWCGVKLTGSSSSHSKKVH